jgi:hypothetical protein
MDENRECPQIRFRDGVNIGKPLLVLEVPEMQRFLLGLARQCPNMVSQLHGLQVFGFAGDGSGKHKPFGASPTERKALIARLINVNNKGGAHSSSSD